MGWRAWRRTIAGHHDFGNVQSTRFRPPPPRAFGFWRGDAFQPTGNLPCCEADGMYSDGVD